MSMTMMLKTNWYALDMNGDMVYLGEYEDFEGAVTDADEDDGRFVWIASEETARTWLTQLKEMMK